MSIRNRFLPHVLMPSGGHASRLQQRLNGAHAQGMGRSTSKLLIASLMLGVSSAAVLAGDDSSSKPSADQATNQALLKKLEAMEKRMQALESELKQQATQIRGRRSRWPLTAPVSGADGPTPSVRCRYRRGRIAAQEQ